MWYNQTNNFSLIQKPVTEKLCDSTTIQMPFNLPDLNYCVIPAWQNIINATIIIISIFIVIMIYRKIKKGEIKIDE